MFWLLCCLRKSVTNRECSSTISLYSIWPAPVARGNAPGIAFSFCVSYFPISQHCCRLSVPSATAQSPATRPQSVFVAAQWSHILHFTLQSQSDCREETGMYTRRVRVPYEWVCREWMSEISWHDVDWGQIKKKKKTPERAELKPCDFICVPFSRWHPSLPLFALFDCMFSRPSIYLVNLSIHHSRTGRRRRRLLPDIARTSPRWHPLAQLSPCVWLSPSFDWSFLISESFFSKYLRNAAAIHLCIDNMCVACKIRKNVMKRWPMSKLCIKHKNIKMTEKTWLVNISGGLIDRCEITITVKPLGQLLQEKNRKPHQIIV